VNMGSLIVHSIR